MDLWAAIIQTIATTVTAMTRAVTTTVQTTTTTLGTGTGTGRGGQGLWDRLSESNELWAALLGALVGALIGGLATAVGSYILHQIQSKKDIRIQMYGDLIPKVASEYEAPRIAIEALRAGTSRGAMSPPTMQLVRHLGQLRRAGAIVGGEEGQIAWEMWKLMQTHMKYRGTEINPSWRMGGEGLLAMDQEFLRLVGKLHTQLERKLNIRSAEWENVTPNRD